MPLRFVHAYTLCFVGMATKAKLVLIFICCLLLTNTVMGSRNRRFRCVTACNSGDAAMKRFCTSLTGRFQYIRTKCLALVSRRSCLNFCTRYFNE